MHAQIDVVVAELERFDVGQKVGAIGAAIIAHLISRASAGQCVVGQFAAEDRGVDTVAAIEVVVANAAGDRIVAIRAVDRIVTNGARKYIITDTTIDDRWGAGRKTVAAGARIIITGRILEAAGIKDQLVSTGVIEVRARIDGHRIIGNRDIAAGGIIDRDDRTVG